MKIKKFGDLTTQQLDYIIDVHFNHWINFNPKMKKEDTIHKFTNIYTKGTLPFGVALLNDKNDVVGFCVFKIENLKKYPQIFPWLSDVMIIEKFRGNGYGRLLIENGEKILKELGYNKVYVWTDQAPDFYKKLGFVYKQEVEKNEGGTGKLFCKDI